MKVKFTQQCLTLCHPMDYTVHGILQARTGVGSLSLLQGIFPTQGLNPGLPHCRWILYQVSYQGNRHEDYLFTIILPNFHCSGVGLSQADQSTDWFYYILIYRVLTGFIIFYLLIKEKNNCLRNTGALDDKSFHTLWSMM